MSAVQIKASLTYTLTQERDKDDAALAFDRNLCGTFYAELGDYTSIMLLCDRGEISPGICELDEMCPSHQLWLNDHSSLIVEVWQNGTVIAGGLWQVVWSEEQQNYLFCPICAVGIDFVPLHSGSEQKKERVK